MKKFLSLKYLTSACFLVLLGIMLAGSLRPVYYEAYHQLQNLRSGNGISISEIEYEYNDALPGKQLYITLNGGFRRLLGQRYVNERYRLDNGHLSYVIPEMDVTAPAENTAAFRDTLEEMGIPFAYVNTLFKLDPQDKQLPQGVEDYSEKNTDQFLALLEEKGVTALDLRQREQEQGLDHYSLYYITDHHWTAETGFWAFTQITDWLTSLDDSFAVDPAFTREDNYSRTVYEDIFCGSAARRVGPLYAGLDDMTVIVPQFDTALTYEDQEQLRQGSYEETLLFYEHLTRENMLENSVYGVYLGEDKSEVRITNQSRQQELPLQSTSKRLLILKDSSALVVAPYLALSYDEIALIDLRLFEGSLLDYIARFQPDMVLTIYNPGVFETHNMMLFDFNR